VAVKETTVFFWVVTSCRLVAMLTLRRYTIGTSALKMGTLCFSEELVHQSARYTAHNNNIAGW
jgi:hypothetical protein